MTTSGQTGRLSQATSLVSPIWKPFTPEPFQIEMLCPHRHPPLRRARPVLARPVPAEFQANAVRIAQIEALAHPVVGGAFEGDVGALQAAQGIRQGSPGRVADGDVVEPRRTDRWLGVAGVHKGCVYATLCEDNTNFVDLSFKLDDESIYSGTKVRISSIPLADVEKVLAVICDKEVKSLDVRPARAKRMDVTMNF